MEDPKEQWNVIAMSDSGKPIFWQFGNEEEILTTCGIIQALRASSSASGLGDMQSLRSKDRSILFMIAGSITLVAVSKQGSAEEVQLLMKLQLEYLYAQIIFTMTHQVQSILAQNPNYDVGEGLEVSDTMIRTLLDDISVEGSVGNFLTGAVEVVGPIEHNVRQESSMTLLEIGEKIPDTVFAIILVGEKILSLVQSSYLPHQLHPSDLKLLTKFISGQAGLLTSELWSPVCLPRFNSSGFLYSYSACLHEQTKLTLVLVSQINTTDQFELFRQGSIEIRRALGLPLAMDSVLKIVDDGESTQTSLSNDVAWKRVDDLGRESENVSSSSVVQDISNEDSSNSAHTQCTLSHQGDKDSFRKCPLLKEVKNAIDPEKACALADKYLDIGGVIHFVFRRDVEVASHSSKERGLLPQCFSPPLGFPFLDTAAKRRVWSMYQKLCLRMRLGTATTVATWAGFSSDNDIEGNPLPDEEDLATNHQSVLSSAAMALVESIPEINGTTYVVDGTELFLAMNGRGFELYAIFPASATVTDATSFAAKLARRLVAESATLFLSAPLTWKD